MTKKGERIDSGGDGESVERHRIRFFPRESVEEDGSVQGVWLFILRAIGENSLCALIFEVFIATKQKENVARSFRCNVNH